MILDLQDILDALGGIGIVILIFVIVIVLLTFALQIGIKAVKGEDTKLGHVFITGLLVIIITSVISFIIGLFLPIWIGNVISLLIGLFIIKARHDTTLLGALAAIIIYVIMVFVIIFVLSLVFTEFLPVLLDFLT